jgi:hypothetical protein
MAVHITVSLKEALRERPRDAQAHPKSRPGQVTYDSPRPARRQVSPDVVMSDFWTAEEFRTYRYLMDVVYTGHAAGVKVDATTKANCDVFLQRFVQKHGKEKCDMMLDELRRLDEQSWFKPENIKARLGNGGEIKLRVKS